MAFDLSCYREELESELTYFLISSNTFYNERWFGEFFTETKTKKLIKNLRSRIESIIQIKCLIETEQYYSYVTGSYNNSCIRIILPPLYFKNYINGYINNNQIESLISPIIDIILHETIHYNQDKSANFKILNYGKIPAHLSGSNYLYFSSSKEIEAWAIYSASELSRYFNKSILLSLLSSNHTLLSNHSKIFKTYKTLFSNTKTINIFLKKIAHHISTF